MTTTARQATRRLANTGALAELVIFGWDYDRCELCGTPAAELFWRTDEAGAEVSVCEHCADTADLGSFDCD